MHYVSDFPAETAGVGFDRAADDAGNRAEKFKSAEFVLQQMFFQINVAKAGAAGYGAVADGNFLKACVVQFDNHAGHAAVANQQVGSAADQADRNVVRFVAQEMGKVAGVFRNVHDFGVAADAEPGVAGKADVLQIAAADDGQNFDQRVFFLRHFEADTEHFISPPAVLRPE